MRLYHDMKICHVIKRDVSVSESSFLYVCLACVDNQQTIEYDSYAYIM